VKLLHLIYTKGISGAEKYLMDLLPGLKPHGIECELMLVTPGKPGDQLIAYRNRMNELGITTTILSARRTGFIFAAGKLNRYLRKKGIHILHAHLFNADLLAALTKQFFYPDLFVISTKHGYSEKVLRHYTGKTETTRYDLYYRLTRYALKRIDQNISISDGISQLYRNLGFTDQLYPVIPHGVNIRSLPEQRTDSPFRFAEQQLIVVGRLEEFKGHHFLIEALPEVVRQYPGLVLVVIGEGSRKAYLQKQVQSLRLEKQVLFLGFREDPYSYMTNSDLIVVPSSFEPFGLVFIESFALQVPVIAFNAPAADEIIMPGKTGILVERNNSRLLAEQIINLLSDPGQRKSLAANAFERYTRFYNTARMCSDTAEFYSRLGTK